MRLWLIPMTYVAASAVCGIVWPRIWRHFLSSYVVDVSVASAQAVLAAVASGMMALTGLVFALAFVMVQFSAIAYSPRLVNWLARDPLLYHAMGAFSATFIYALFTLVIRCFIMRYRRSRRFERRAYVFDGVGRSLDAVEWIA